ncbi:UNVERIFIED_CONTAM: hypothetical protein K2H54_048982 [Gekko kuhli]
MIISILTVTASNVSGIYFCIASNKAGKDERSIKFYVSAFKREIRASVIGEIDIANPSMPTSQTGFKTYQALGEAPDVAGVEPPSSTGPFS